MSEKNKSDMLRAPFKLEYDYERSTGPIIGKFFEGLSNQQILGTKNGDNVYVPAAEFDPITYEHLSEFVELPETGTVKSFTWIDQPRKHHLINKPFAFALIQIDGATSSILHMITNLPEFYSPFYPIQSTHLPICHLLHYLQTKVDFLHEDCIPFHYIY